jgi:hypothetical protein
MTKTSLEILKEQIGFISFNDIDRECGDKDCTECQYYFCMWNPNAENE